jgi:predicted nucleotidyltransferase
MSGHLDARLSAASAVLANGPCRVISAYLFGSQSSGRPHAESDIDIAVLLEWSAHPTGRERFEVRLDLLGLLAEPLGTDRVDLVVLNDLPPLFARRIVTEGQRFFCANAAEDHVFVRDVQLKAADQEPFLRRMRQIKLAAIARE